MRAYRFRIYPSKKQEEEMCRHLWVSKELWNEMLAFTKEIYNNYQRFSTRKTLREMVKQSGLFSQVNQELVDRLVDALHRKIEMKKKGERCCSSNVCEAGSPHRLGWEGWEHVTIVKLLVYIIS